MSKERLSRLQKWILCQAYLEGKVYRRQIYKEFYGLSQAHYQKNILMLGRKKAREERGWEWYDKANKAYSAVCSSLRRLRERGLIEMREDYGRYLDPIRLTDRGKEMVECLK